MIGRSPMSYEYVSNRPVCHLFSKIKSRELKQINFFTSSGRGITPNIRSRTSTARRGWMNPPVKRILNADGIETRRRQRSSSYYIASQPWPHACRGYARSSEEFLRMKGHCQLLAFASALILLPLAAYSQNPNAPGSQNASQGPATGQHEA